MQSVIETEAPVEDIAPQRKPRRTKVIIAASAAAAVVIGGGTAGFFLTRGGSSTLTAQKTVTLQQNCKAGVLDQLTNPSTVVWGSYSIQGSGDSYSVNGTLTAEDQDGVPGTLDFNCWMDANGRLKLSPAVGPS